MCFLDSDYADVQCGKWCLVDDTVSLILIWLHVRRNIVLIQNGYHYRNLIHSCLIIEGYMLLIGKNSEVSIQYAFTENI